jgi:hypothetical protein
VAIRSAKHGEILTATRNNWTIFRLIETLGLTET